MDYFLFCYLILLVHNVSPVIINKPRAETTTVSLSSKTVIPSHVFRTRCPNETFPCSSDGICINTSLMCDRIPHCKDGSDEGSLCDTLMADLYSGSFNKRVEITELLKHKDNCTLKNFPSYCQCYNSTQLHCDYVNVSRFQLNQPSNATVLTLKGNTIENISSIARGFLPNLTVLNIGGNQIKELRSGDFDKMSNLTELHVQDNEISEISDNTFINLHRLQILYLFENKLSEIRMTYFTGLVNLVKLDLKHNFIVKIEVNAFRDMRNLKTLTLYSNRLQVLQNGVFTGLSELVSLNLQMNRLVKIEDRVMADLPKVQSVDLYKNKLKTIENGTFSYNKDLKYIYFDKFYMCIYAKQAAVCRPQGDGISSKENLLESIVLRISVWLVALLACGGNLIVILGRFFMREDNRIHSFFIKNLSLADFLMGLYLLIIAVTDVKYRGAYIVHDESWRNSWECDFSGILSTLSTEMSVLTLSVITLDRYISIMYPLSFRKRGLKQAYFVMGFTWLICIVLAVLPVSGLDYFGKSFYRDNAVCIPLHLHDPRAKGWEFSSFLFLGINFGSFGFIAYAYAAMFYSIQMSALPLRTSRESKERCLVQRFFFIVITDFVCWIPIIIIKILALSGVEISEELYAWVIVFVLPVNSALNPMLYTLTTKLFKKKLFSKFTFVVFRSSVKSVGSSMTRPMQYCEMGLLKRYYPTSSTRKSAKDYMVDGSPKNADHTEDTHLVTTQELTNGNALKNPLNETYIP
ncbi:relaxin receptor 1-like isoform X2 [Physella acuta]|uniref:relaxin receptor 1-like isoform X2 n=1 Tax=Physella acuta TaxID=109671 RepID=UPI0027DC7537|nr:relaxin receptor 1-like isoform X2 [Physella acuta]